MRINVFDLDKFDEYNRRARIYPALFVLLPVILSAVVWFPEGFVGLGVFLSVLTWAGVSYFLANVARDLGKQKEVKLYKLWGGKPTTKFLRYRDAQNSEMLRHIHRKLHELFPDINIPTEQEEVNNPTQADEAYDVCTRRVIERTRDKQKFEILFNENCSYGFRRNLWGMKKPGVFLATVGFLFVIINSVYTYFSLGVVEPLAVLVASINFVILLFWLFYITPEWVRIPAEAYAERLFASIENVND